MQGQKNGPAQGLRQKWLYPVTRRCDIESMHSSSNRFQIWLHQNQSAGNPDRIIYGYFIKSNRTQSKEDGSFSVSYSIEGIGYTIEYKFIDAERNTMEAKVMLFSDSENDVSQSEDTENEVMVCIMKRLIDHEIKINVDAFIGGGK